MKDRNTMRWAAILLVALVLPAGVAFGANSMAPVQVAPSVGDVLINEYVAKPSVTETTEWVELYNTTASTLDIGGMWIDDIASGGGAPKEIPAGTTIAAGGYYVMTFGSFLNNTGDDVRLLSADQATVHDSTSYTSTTADLSWCRTTDGGAWSGTECDPTTQGANNNPGATPSAPSVGDVLVNEFLADNLNEPSEWVELYNTTGASLDISGMWIDDIAAGGGAPKEIPANTIIAAGGYYVMTFSGFLNNGGDDVRLLSVDQATVHDSYTYSGSSDDMTSCRKPDGGAWSAIDCDPTQGATNSPALPAGTWTPGNLEIHVLNVGQGESQLIIGPDGRTLLIGVWEPSWNTNQGATWVASEIRRITGGSHVNYIMPSHWHLDHMGYATYGGIWSLLEEQGITADAIIDRDGGYWNDANADGICDPTTEVVWTNAGTVSGTARNWICWVDDPSTAGGAIRELAVIGSTTQIDLGAGVTTTVVQVDADGVMMADGVTPLQGDHTLDATPPSENDYSITLWINWDKFDYVTGGDTDGEYNTSSFGYTYNDVESDVASRINQEVEVIWGNHHGSDHSTQSAYVTTLSPLVAIFSPGSTNTYGHPSQRILDLLFGDGIQMYFPQIGDGTRDYHDAVIVNGNVEVKVTNGVDFTVNGDAYVSTDPVGGGGGGAPRVPNVGEVVINELVASPSVIETSEWVELYNTTSETLDIGGMWIDDIAGGGGAPKQIPAGTLIAPGGYYVMDGFNSFLNNGGDDVRLLSTDQATVHDSYTYGSSTNDTSRCRVTDGGAWVAGNCSPTTKGAAN